MNFFHFSSKKQVVTCGCFRGTLKELEAKVKEVHAGTKHEADYMNQIRIMKYLMKNTQ